MRIGFPEVFDQPAPLATPEKFWRELVARYEETEKTKEPIPGPTFDGLHKMFADSTCTIADVIAKLQEEQESLAEKSN